MEHVVCLTVFVTSCICEDVNVYIMAEYTWDGLDIESQYLRGGFEHVGY